MHAVRACRDSVESEGELTYNQANGAPYTNRMAGFCVDFDFRQLPEEVVSEAKKVTLDLVGSILAASAPQYGASQLIGDYVRLIGGNEECTVVGRNFRTSCVNAALANGTMAYAADIEGGLINPQAPQHAGAVLVPVALAMAEREKTDGRRFLAALVLGIEVSARVGEACRTPRSYPHSFHTSAVFGHFGAAACAAHLLGLKMGEFTNALGLAGMNATGLINWVTDLTEHSRPYVIGVASSNGVRSALLAKLGFGGPPAIFDATKFNIYEAFSTEMHLDRLTEDLGKKYWIMDNLGFKPYPCCYDIFTGLDALLGIMREQELVGRDIKEIVHRVKNDRAPTIDNNPIKSHNAQYIMAVAATRGSVMPDDILEDRRSDPQVLDMYRRVRLVGDAELDTKAASRPAAVAITTNDGREFSKSVDWPTGSPQNPMSQTELEAKFVRLATTVTTSRKAKQIMSLVERLEDVSNVAELAGLLRG
jgi:2-methylcitrate dehydratase PrpD